MQLPDWCTTDDFAAAAGLSPTTGRRTLAHWRSTGRPIHNPIPPPDDTRLEGGKARPVWRDTTVRAWLARRPGRGVRPNDSDKETGATPMNMQLITNVENQFIDGYTRGWIVPLGTDPAADPELESAAHVDIPASEVDTEWHQGLRDSLAAAGWAVAGPVVRDGSDVMVEIQRI